MNRTYHESVRFPKPPDDFELVLKKRDANNNFEEIWRLPINPNDYMVHREAAKLMRTRLSLIHESGDPATKVDLLLLGDGYTEEEHNDFVQKARELTGDPVRDLSVQGAQGRLQYLGAGAFVGEIGRVAPLDKHVSRYASRCHLRCLSCRALCADFRQQEHAADRVVHTV